MDVMWICISWTVSFHDKKYIYETGTNMLISYVIFMDYNSRLPTEKTNETSRKNVKIKSNFFLTHGPVKIILLEFAEVSGNWISEIGDVEISSLVHFGLKPL